MAAKPQILTENLPEKPPKIIETYLGVSFAVFLGLLPKSAAPHLSSLQSRNRILSLKLFQAEDQLRGLRSRRKEDSKANARVVEVFATHRQAWRQGERRLALRAEAAEAEAASLEERVAELEAEVERLEREVGERDELIEFVMRKDDNENEEEEEEEKDHGEGFGDFRACSDEIAMAAAAAAAYYGENTKYYYGGFGSVRDFLSSMGDSKSWMERSTGGQQQMFKRMFGSGSGGGSRSRGGGSGNSSRGHGSGYADDSRDRDQWGTAGSQEVQPDTADRLRGIPQFQTDDPATSTTAEPVYYRDFTGDIDAIPLPHAASRTSAMCERHHPIAVQRYMQLSDDVRRRVRDVKEQIARRKGDSIYEKAGRSGNRVVTKRPPSGRRIVLEWSDTPRVPIGEWATRFNNMVGCLVKRADFINPYFKFNEQPFKSFEEIWRELMKSYCLEDYPFTWDYLFGANGKVQSLLRSWRFDIKNEYYNKIEEDWERFWKFDPRIDTHHFGALLMYWDDPKILDKSAKAKVNRASMEVDHFLGTQSFAQVEHKYKKKTGKPTMPVNFLIAEGYTPKAGYDKATKREKIQKWKEEVDAQMAQLLQETQSSQEGSNLDPHLLSRQQNDQIIESVFGPSKKGRRRFRGGGTWTDDSTTSSEPTMHTPSNMSQQSDNSSSVHGLLTGVIAILASRIDPALFASVVPALYADIPSQIPFAIQHIILCLANRIPNEVYVDIVTYVMGINNNQGRDTAGSTSGMHGGDNQDYDGTNDGNDDDNDEDDNDDDDDGTE